MLKAPKTIWKHIIVPEIILDRIRSMKVHKKQPDWEIIDECTRKDK